MRVALATPEDRDVLVDLLHELHRYYNPASAVPPSVVREHLERNLLALTSPTKLAVATDDAGTVAGFAAVLLLHSLVEPEPHVGVQCLLKELFVSEAWRGRGVGRALMTWVASYAVEHGCSRIDWNVKASNVQGIAFYERLGARVVGDRLSYRLSQSGISELAAVLRPCD